MDENHSASEKILPVNLEINHLQNLNLNEATTALKKIETQN